jgi:hypothetical protein
MTGAEATGAFGSSSSYSQTLVYFAISVFNRYVLHANDTSVSTAP